MQTSPQAIHIVEYNEETVGKDKVKGVWKLTQQGRSMLNEIKTDISVVGICGIMRTGKSYIMNLLASVDTVNFSLPEKQIDLFALGGTVESKTRGVWGYVRPFRHGSLLLLDFEGMFDPSGLRSNENFNPQIFLLAVLCSSYFLYNTKTAINSEDLKALDFVANTGDHMTMSSTSNDSDVGFESQFPKHFAWVLRDAYLKLENTSPKEYLEKMLSLSAIKNKSENAANMVRTAIKDQFQNRTCFCLPMPCPQEQLTVVNELPFSTVDGTFRTSVKDMIKEILTDIEPKNIRDHRGNTPSRLVVKGKEFCVLLESLLEQLNTSKIFCVEDAWINVSRTVTQAAFDKAVSFFSNGVDVVAGDGNAIIESNDWLEKVSKLTENAFNIYIKDAILREEVWFGSRRF